MSGRCLALHDFDAHAFYPRNRLALRQAFDGLPDSQILTCMKRNPIILFCADLLPEVDIYLQEKGHCSACLEFFCCQGASVLQVVMPLATHKSELVRLVEQEPHIDGPFGDITKK